MAAGVGPIVTGDKELDRALALLEPKLQKQGLRKATREAAKIVAADARARVPEDSGELEQSIKVRALKRSRVRQGHGIAAGSDFHDSGLPYYAGWVEFGTRPRFHADGKYAGASPSQPFLRPALWDNSAAIKDTAVRILRDWVRTVKEK